MPNGETRVPLGTIGDLRSAIDDYDDDAKVELVVSDSNVVLVVVDVIETYPVNDGAAVGAAIDDGAAAIPQSDGTLPFVPGQGVTLNGHYQGTGTVIECWDGPNGTRSDRPDQQYPQVSVRCDDERKRLYNGDDIRRGVVR